jgi:6-phosphogluconolactonase/glucosamine-6-phosphate isomerase/deaminase
MQVYLNGGLADVNDSFEMLIPEFGKLKFPTKRARTVNHKLFNQYLQEKAKTHNLNYIDSFEKLIGSDECLSAKYACASDGGRDLQLGGDGKDIHIGGQYALEIQAELAKRIFQEFFSHAQNRMQI